MSQSYNNPPGSYLIGILQKSRKICTNFIVRILLVPLYGHIKVETLLNKLHIGQIILIYNSILKLIDYNLIKYGDLLQKRLLCKYLNEYGQLDLFKCKIF